MALAGILGWALLLATRIDRPIGATFLPILAAALLLANLGLVLGAFDWVRLAVPAAGLAALVWCLVADRKGALARLAAPSAVLVVLGSILLGVMAVHAELTSFDEFSHWGKVAKFIGTTGVAPTPATYAGFLDYPFGLAALESMFLWPGAFSERIVILVQGVLVLASFAAIGERFRWRDWWILAALVIGLVAFRYLFQPHPWGAILPDTAVGAAAAGAAAIYWRGDGGWRGIVLAAPILAALPLMKDVGLFLAVPVIAFMTIDQAVRFAVGKAVIESIAAVVLAILLVLVVKAIWSGHVAAIEAGTTFQLAGSHALGRLATATFGPDAAAIIAAFIEQLRTAPIAFRRAPALPLWLAGIGIVAVIAAALARTREAVSRIVLANLVFLIAGALYAAGLLALYLFSFSVYEAVRSASFSRYMGTYAAFWLLANLAFLADPPFRSLAARVTAFVVLAAFSAGVIHTVERTARRDISGYLAGTPGDVAVRDIRAAIRERLGDPPSGTVNLVWTGSSGVEYFAATLELVPRLTGMPACFSPGPPRFEGDVWSCDLAPEALADLLRQRDYLALANSDDLFWERYGSLFVEDARESGAVWFRFENGRLTPVR